MNIIGYTYMHTHTYKNTFFFLYPLSHSLLANTKYVIRDVISNLCSVYLQCQSLSFVYLKILFSFLKNIFTGYSFRVHIFVVVVHLKEVLFFFPDLYFFWLDFLFCFVLFFVCLFLRFGKKGDRMKYLSGRVGKQSSQSHIIRLLVRDFCSFQGIWRRNKV